MYNYYYKKKEYWDHFISSQKYWNYFFTKERLDQLWKSLVDNENFWFNILIYNKGNYMSLKEMKKKKFYEYFMSNMSNKILERMFKEGIIK